MDEYYQKKKGGGGAHGIDYQLKVLMLFLLKAYKTGKDFKLSSENFNDGKLDDVVLTTDEYNMFAQTKHKDNESETISLEALFSEGHEFSLIKYLKSFKKKYYTHLQQLHKDIEMFINERSEIHELELLSKTVAETFERSCNSHEELFERLTHKIRDLKNETLIKQIEWFENSTIHLISNIEPHLKLKKLIVTEKIVKKNVILESYGTHYAFITDEVLNRLSESDKKSVEFFITYFLGKFELVVLKDDELTEHNKELLSNLDIYTDQREFRYVYSFILEKIKQWYQSNKGYYLKRLHLEVFFSDLYNSFYVEELSKFRNKFHFEIDNLLEEIHDKSVTLINTPRYLLLMVKLYEKWLTQIKKGKILFVNPDENIKIQQCLTNSFKYDKYTHYICPLIINKNLELATEINKLPLESKGQTYKKIILLGEIDSKIITNRKVTVVSDKELYGDLTLTGVTRLKSLGTTEKYYVKRKFKHKYDYFSEDEFLKTVKKSSEKFFLIIDGPGMGKTTLLTSLACQINQLDNCWALNIELSRHFSLLREALEDKNLRIEDFLPFSSKSTYQDIIDRQIFTIPNAIFLMVDAVDEVSPKYTDIVLNLLKSTSERVAKIIVTSREHLKTKLSKSLDVVPYSLEIFTEKDQKNFIKSFWIGSLDLKEDDEIEKCETYCEKLLNHLKYSMAHHMWGCLGIPLQTRMVAEIFVKGIISEFPGCQQYLAHREGNLTFPNNLNLGKLYDSFIKKKREIYVEEKCNIQGNISAEEGLKKEFDEYMDLCQVLAVRIIFDSKYWFYFSKYKQITDVIDENIYKIGLLILPINKWWSEDMNSEKPQFVHRTFTEYFLAKIICKRLIDFKSETGFFRWIFPQRNYSNPTQMPFPIFFLTKVLLKAKYVIVQQFIECELRENSSCINHSLSYLFAKELRKTSMNEDQNLNLLGRHGSLYILKLLLNGSKSHKEWINKKFGEENENILHESIKHLDVVKLLVEHGADVNLKGLFNKTALHYAAENGYYDVVKYLVKKVSNIDEETQCELTPLHEALFNGHTEIVKYLIKEGASIRKRTGGGWTSLHYAALAGNQEIVTLLLEKGVDINEETTKNSPGKTALHISFEKQHFPVWEYLLQHGSDANLKDARGWGLWSYAVTTNRDSAKKAFDLLVDNREHYGIGTDSEAVVLAIKDGNYELVEHLIDLGFDINLKNQEGLNSLHSAIMKGNCNISKLLLEKGADEKIITTKGFTVIHLAAAEGDLEMFQFVENIYSNITSKTPKGLTTLHLAAKSGHLDLVKHICKECSNDFIFEKSSDGRNTLHHAASRGELEIVQYLIDVFHFNLDTKATNGETVLHVAVSDGNIDLIKFIICSLASKQVDLNFKYLDGSFIKYLPSKKNPEEISNTLLEAGVKKEAINSNW